ncbi:conjugal transfer nickase/helicase domain-containing protein [Orbus mooreae]|uniref:conjugal transfer nickase/helicase domain-containing protein n=1 Tax=Orbus mooreae TaxID=3074107 RepID=UPI00370D44DB
MWADQPSLVWPDEKPSSFDGTVTINLKTTETQEEIDITADSIQGKIAIAQQTQDTFNHEVIAPSNNAPSADSLEAVFDLLELNETVDQEVPEESSTPLIANKDNIDDESNSMKDIANTINAISPIVRTDNKITSSIIEFTETEKQVMKQIDDFSPSGEHFVQWLKEAILTQKLILNEPQALVHTVDETIFIVTPGIFMRYVMEFPLVQQIAKIEKIPAWRYMQKVFEKLKYHKRTADGHSIWICAVEGPKSTKKVHGYLLNDPTIFIPDIVYNNPYLKIITNTSNAC